MRRAGKILKIVFISILLVNCAPLFAADLDEGLVARPVIEYTSAGLRDPFADQLQLAIQQEKKEEELKAPEVSQEEAVLEEPMPDLGSYNVQGVIWGGGFPQAIINNRVFSVGDSMDGFQITGIEKTGIILNFSGRTVSLPAPGNAPVLETGVKEEK
jgi:hypothetical protein